MNINDFKHRITFQERVKVKNSYQELEDIWNDVKTVWASVMPVAGKEYFSAETVNSEITHKVRIRYLKGLKPEMRIKFKDRIFSIISIINFSESNTSMQIMCKEVL